MKKLLLASVVALLASSSAFADNTDSDPMTITGKVIKALAITTGNDLEMPELAAPDVNDTGGASATTNVRVTCSSTGTATIQYGNNGNPFAAGTAATTTVAGASQNASIGDSTAQCGSMGVAGEATYKYMVAYTAPTAAGGVTVSEIACKSATNTDNAGTLSAGGTDTLYCGALVTAAVGATTGDYSQDATIAVTYD